MPKKKDYEVGYRKPPKNTQFRKGQSGNPSGRPKKVLTHEEIVARELDKKIAIVEDGKKKRVSKREVIFKKQVNLAMQGDHKATRFVIDACDTALKRRVADEPGDEGPMVVTLVFDEEDERQRQIEEANRRYRQETGECPDDL